MAASAPASDNKPPPLERASAVAFVVQQRSTATALGALFLALHLPLADGLRTECPTCGTGGAFAAERSRSALPNRAIEARFGPNVPLLTGLPGSASVLRPRASAVAGSQQSALEPQGTRPGPPSGLVAGPITGSPSINEVGLGTGLPGTLATLAPFDAPPTEPGSRPSAIAGELFTAAPPQTGGPIETVTR